MREKTERFQHSQKEQLVQLQFPLGSDEFPLLLLLSTYSSLSLSVSTDIIPLFIRQVNDQHVESNITRVSDVNKAIRDDRGDLLARLFS